MIGSNVRRALVEQVGTHAGPLLSLYIDVNPANTDNTPKAFVLRAAEAMRRIDLDKGFIDKITTKLSQEFVRAQGRSLVIFAAQDPDQLFNAYYLQTRLPFLGLSDGALANWGPPFTAPLLFALDQKERYAVIYVSTDHVRVFEVFLGQIEELNDYVRPIDTDSWQPYTNARRSPAFGVGVAARGGAAVDAFRDRLEEATARLYRTLLPEVEKALEAEEVDRVILVGLPSAIAAFQDAMSSGLLDKVVGSVAPPANPDGPPREWLPLVTDAMAEAEAAHEMALLDRVRETGVWGLQETLSMLQDRRLHTLVVPFEAEQRVYRWHDGRLSATPDGAAALAPGETVEETSLLEVLPELIEQSGTVLEFVAGEAEARLNEEFGGMAGIARW